MAQKIESKWQTLRHFIDGYLQENTNYRAGAIYEAYLTIWTKEVLHAVVEIVRIEKKENTIFFLKY